MNEPFPIRFRQSPQSVCATRSSEPNSSGEYNWSITTQAKLMLSRLVARVCAGVEAVLLYGGTRLAKLLPAKDRVPGRLAGRISWTLDAFDPLTDQELSNLGFE